MLSSFLKKEEMGIGVCLKRYKNLGRTDILIRLTLPTKVRGSVLQAAHLPVREETTGVRFSVIYCERSLFTMVPKYLN